MRETIGTILLVCLTAAIVALTVNFSRKATGRYGYFVAILVILSSTGVAILSVFGPFSLFADSTFYQDSALTILDWWNSAGANPYGDLWQTLYNKMAWPTLMAGIYWLIGVQPAAVLLLNVLLISITAVFIAASAKTMRRNLSLDWRFTTLFLLAPFIYAFGISLGRESIYWFATAVMTYATAQFLAENWLRASLFFISAAIILVVFRPNLGIPQLYAFAIPLLFAWATRIHPFNLRKIVQVLAVGLLIGLTIIPAKNLITAGANPVSVTRNALSENAESGFDAPTSVTENSGSDEAAPIPAVESELEGESRLRIDSTSPALTGTSWLDFALASLQTLPRGLLGPFPSEFSLKPSIILAMMNLAYWLVIVALAVIGVSRRWRRLFGLTFLSTSFLIVAIISSLLTNYGILVRFRAVAVLTLLPYAFYVFVKLTEDFGKRNHRKAELHHAKS